MRRLLLLAIILTPLFARAQQPDLQVRVLSLYHLKSIRVIPLDASAQMRTCKTCVARRIPAPLDLALKANALDVAGSSASELRLSGKLRVEAARAAPIEITYPLTLRIIDGAIAVLATMPMEDYVAIAVQGESSGQMPPEALKALAITVRTYAMRFRNRHQSFDFCDSTHCQHLTMLADEPVKQAVAATRAQILWERGRPAMAFHHQDCGGRREAAADQWPDMAAPYLDSRSDPYCIREKHNWQSTLTRDDLTRVLDASGITLPRNWDHVVITARTPSGRAKLLRFVAGNSRGTDVSASTLRFAVGRTLGWNVLKSDLYELSQSGTQLTFTGRGSGHGVGLCQLGAIEMARQGKSYGDILGFYFPGTKVGVSAQGIEWKTIRGDNIDLMLTGTSESSQLLLQQTENLLRDAERITGLRTNSRPTLQVFSTVALFRDATGEPGWVAASTRGKTIRLQPPDVLGARGQLQSSLRHELLHLVIESHAHAGLPLWFREGLVLSLANEPTAASSRSFTTAQLEAALRRRTDPAALREAYAAAKLRVTALTARHGKQTVLGWLTTGLPQNVAE